MYNNDLIGSRQLRAFLIINIVSIGMIFFPQTAVAFSGVDGWIGMVASILFSLFYGMVLCFVLKKSNGLSFIRLCKKRFGNFFCLCMAVFFYLKQIIIGGLMLRVFSEIIKANFFDSSVMWISFVFLAFCVYSTSIDFQRCGRLSEILLLFFIVPVIFVLIIGLLNGSVENVKPVMVENHIGVVKGGFLLSLFFVPLEFLLLSAENINIRRLDKVVIQSLIFSTIILSSLIFVLLARFGAEDVRGQVFPVLEMIYSIELPGAFVERLEVVVITFIMIGMFFVIHSFMFFSAKIIDNLADVGQNCFTVVFSALFMYDVASMPLDVTYAIDSLFTVIKYSGIFSLVVLPLVLSFGGRVLEKD